MGFFKGFPYFCEWFLARTVQGVVPPPPKCISKFHALTSQATRGIIRPKFYLASSGHLIYYIKIANANQIQ